MKEFGLAIIAIIIVILVVVALSVLGLVFDRHAQPYAVETDKRAYDSSRQYQQSTQLDLSRYCREWVKANGPAKSAVANLIRDTAATYTGPLTPANQACLSQIGE